MTETNPHLMGRCVTFTKTISESDVYLFAGITGDLSPYHVDAEKMRVSPYGQRLVHGVLALGILSTASTKFWQDASYESQGVSLGYDRVRFVAPVFIGDTLTANYRVTKWDEQKGRYLADGVVQNQQGETCVIATHITKVIDMNGRSKPRGQE